MSRRNKLPAAPDPLQTLAARLEALQSEVDRTLEAEGDGAHQAKPRLRVARSVARRREGKGLVQRAREASSLFDAGREELFASLESQVVKRISALLDIPTRSELDALAHRVEVLERRLAPPPGPRRKKRT